MRSIYLWFSLLITLTHLLLQAAIAAEDKDEDYQFSWLDPDKKVYVLQNRRYRKANRLGVFLSAGSNLSNPFKSEYLGSGRATFWLTEQFGVEGMFSFYSNSDNSTLLALKTVNSTALPFVRENRSAYGGLITWAPWYAKINFFNKILYFDWFVSGGIGQLLTAVDRNRIAAATSNYRNEALFAGLFGTGLNFYLTNHFSVRFDLAGLAYRATGADDVTVYTFTNFDFTAGIGFLF